MLETVKPPSHVTISNVMKVRNKFFNHFRVKVGGPSLKSFDSMMAKAGKIASASRGEVGCKSADMYWRYKNN